MPPILGRVRSLRETDMRKSRFTEEQIIKVLKEHAAGLSASELCRKYGVRRSTSGDRAIAGEGCPARWGQWANTRCSCYVLAALAGACLVTMVAGGVQPYPI